MDLNQKSIVKIDGDGTVIKCAKSLPISECGYEADKKVCGKCGAMAVEIKMVPVDEEDLLEGEESDVPDEEDLLEEPEEEAPMENGKPMLKTKGAGMWQTPKATRRAYTASMQDGLYRPAKGDAMMPDEDNQDEEMYMDDEEYMGMEDEGKGDFGPTQRNRGPNTADGLDRGLRMMDYRLQHPFDASSVRFAKTPYVPRDVSRRAKGEEMMPEDEEMYMDDEGNEYMMDEEGKMYQMPSRSGGSRPIRTYGWRSRENPGIIALADEMMPEGDDEEMYLDDEMMPEGDDEEMYLDDEETEGEVDNMNMTPDLEAMRMARLRKLGTKSADVGMNGYMCAIDRKVYPGAASVCDDCPGGCMAEKGMPGLLHVEGLVEVMFKGEVIDSGYSQDADMYVIDVETKSGSINEVFVDGTSAEVLGFHRLDDSVLSQKSIMDDIELIDFNEAAEIAVKSIPGSVVAVEPAVFEGFDSYQVEIDGVDGKSYDVFVALDGETLGYDSYNSDETAEIEAEAAEIALKRAFPEDKRQEMAKEGTAMPDGSFPIASENDLRNAIMAHGRAKDSDAAKAHIKSRAAALGLEEMLPENWKTAEKSNPAEEFIQSLVEFEMLAAEVDNPSTTK